MPSRPIIPAGLVLYCPRERKTILIQVCSACIVVASLTFFISVVL